MLLSRKWVPLAAAAMVLPILVSLGFWQLNRAKEKSDLQAEYDRRARHAPLSIGNAIQSADSLRFYQVQASGHYDQAHQFLVDNRIHEGQAGYHVITPLVIEGGQSHLLVNRGWVPAGTDRRILPEVAPPTGKVLVKGLATVPSKGGVNLGRLAGKNESWQIVWPRLDLDHYVAITDSPVQPVVVLMNPDSESGGYVRDWKRLDAGIAVHHGYAFQWFSLALVLLTITLYLTLRRRTEGKPDKTDDRA